MSAKQRKKLEEAEEALADYRAFEQLYGTPHNVLLRALTAERQLEVLELKLRLERAKNNELRLKLAGGPS